jgi:Protein of unknown function (DUF3887)
VFCGWNVSTSYISDSGAGVKPFHRSAALRKGNLDRKMCQGYLYAMGEEQELPTQIERAAQLLADALRHTDNVPSGLSTVQLAVSLRQAADQALAACVRQAREAGHTWQELGDVLHTTRQAAFQRFGRPGASTNVDPRTGAPVSEDLLPGAAELALAVFGALFQGLDDQVVADFDETMRAQLPKEKLDDVRLQLLDLVGAYESAGEPFVRRIGQHTVVDVPLEFEAGPMKGRISYDRNSKIAGLFVLNPEVG